MQPEKGQTSISQITTRSPKRFHAVNIEGFRFKTFFVVLAFMSLKYF